MFSRLRQIAQSLRRELSIYRAIAIHPRTPLAAKWCLGMAIGYALLPFDLIPDFIPVIGHLDDVIIITALIAGALWMAPEDVVAECRRLNAEPQPPTTLSH
jgi:uncharacterized membrane protein YkvA (DUF1232 family)